jgi:hypothetical protein
MNKRNLLNLFLFVLILVLVVFVVFQPGKQKATTPPSLTNIKAADVRYITLKRSDEKNAIELIKKENVWFMLKPYQQSANAFRIESLLKLLSAVSFSQNILTDLNPAEFGLDKPLVTITFNKNTSIEFGHNNSLNNHRYVKIGSVLHLIADTFYYQLAANSESFINHKVLPENSQITELTLPSLALTRINGNWQASPKADKFSADAVNQLIDEWQLSQAYDIKMVKISAADIPDIKIKLADNKIFRFKTDQNKDSFNLTNIDSGVRYILSADRRDKLLKLSTIDRSGSQ